MRICSLLPSATEIVASLGLAESLVAVSEECDWPPGVRGLPVVTASRVDTALLSSVEIEKAVRAAVGDGRPLYAIDRELLEALQPDLILTQNLCAVCAVSADNVNELCATDAEVVALDAHTLAEIEGCILSLADLLGVSARGPLFSLAVELPSTQTPPTRDHHRGSPMGSPNSPSSPTPPSSTTPDSPTPSSPPKHRLHRQSSVTSPADHHDRQERAHLRNA